MNVKMKEAKYSFGTTRFTFSPATLEEQDFCFGRENEPIDKACIGHLRGNFGALGKQFHTTWWTHNNALRTEQFEAELDDVINALRNEGVLANRFAMYKRILRYPSAAIQNQYRPESAFRAETEQNLFFLRCMPTGENYNFYCYVYNKEQFYEVQRVQKKMPATCWSVLKSTSEIVLLRYGMKGYLPFQNNGCDKANMQKIVDELNEEVYISKAQVAAMEVGSLFGWNIPAADSRNYDANGQLLRDVKEKGDLHERE